MIDFQVVNTALVDVVILPLVVGEQGWECLNPDEQAEVHSMRIEKRRREKIAGKLAVKIGLHRAMASEEGLSAFCQQRSVLSSEGPPVLLGPEASRWHISLSHSRTYAAAVVSPSGPVGVDLEFVRPIEKGARRFFMVPSELSDCEALENLYGPQPEIVMSWFCGKEAGLKLHGVGLAGVRSLRIPKDLYENGEAYVRYKGLGQKVIIQPFEDHILAVSMLT